MRRWVRSGEVRGRLVGATLATLWLVAVLVVDLVSASPTFVPTTLFALAPLVACAVLPAGPTAVFGGVAILLAAASNQWNHTWGTPQVWVRILDVTLVSAAAVVVAAVRVRRERQLARVERIAEVAQRAVLPVVPTHVGPVTAGARYLSAAEDALVGGDLYDWFHSDRRICFIVGDVRGKGVGAVEQAARVIRAFRQSAAGGADLATMAAQMSAYLAPFLDPEEFATAALVQITGASRVTLVSCGHPSPLFVPSAGEARLLEPPPGLPLGLDLGGCYESVTVTWATGDRLLLYTDGLSEARDAGGEFLSLLPLASLLRVADVEDAVEGLLRQVDRHVPDGRLNDDLAVLLLENTGDGATPADPRDSLLRGVVPAPRPAAWSGVGAPVGQRGTVSRVGLRPDGEHATAGVRPVFGRAGR